MTPLLDPLAYLYSSISLAYFTHSFSKCLYYWGAWFLQEFMKIISYDIITTANWKRSIPSQKCWVYLVVLVIKSGPVFKSSHKAQVWSDNS
jgi:hypothetical protein